MGTAQDTEGIRFRAILEVLGAPQEYVEKSIRLFVDNIKNSEAYDIVEEDIQPAQPAEEEKMFVTFAELEIKTESINDISNFCFDFMPSSIEIIDPDKLVYHAPELSNFFNDLQAKLHDLDMHAKQLKIQNSNLKTNSVKLLRNLILLTLKYQGTQTLEQLGERIGIPAEQLKPIVSKIVQQGKIVETEQGYSLQSQ